MYFRVLFTCSGSITYDLIADATVKGIKTGTQSTFFTFSFFLFRCFLGVWPEGERLLRRCFGTTCNCSINFLMDKNNCFCGTMGAWRPPDWSTPTHQTQRPFPSNSLEIFTVSLSSSFSSDKRTTTFTESKAQRAPDGTRLILTNV